MNASSGRPSVPNVSECLALIDEYEMLDNIKKHSFVVARIAQTIAGNLKLPADITPPDIGMVVAGALLHDIAKTQCLDGTCRHADVGRQICTEHGYPEVAAIVGEHVVLSSFLPDDYERGSFPEREIVYYADKRVKHDQIVPLEERLTYIIDRYGENDKRIEQRIMMNFKRCQTIEHHLFSFLPFNPEDLADHVPAEPF